jgi:hypothetical protein
MARRNPKSRRASVIGVAILFVFGVVVWYGMTHLGWKLENSQTPTAPVEKPVFIDPANDGHKISLSGKLSVPAAARDAELAISVDTVLLLRSVEMYQWREQCSGNDCRYDEVWSTQPIDSEKFHTPHGHENPHFPLTSARFSSGPAKLAGYTIDPQLIAEQITPVNHPVHVAELPTNLAVTFRDADGTLVTGDDPAHPKVGALRVSYRAAPSNAVTLTGVQRGQRLSVD